MSETHVPRIKAAKRSPKNTSSEQPPAAPAVARDGRGQETTITVEGFACTLDFAKIANGSSSPEVLLFWTDLLARAEREQIVLEARYRQFRADATSRLLEKDPKIAEWKAKALLERTDAFQENKAVIAEAQRNVTLLRGVIDALRSDARSHEEE